MPWCCYSCADAGVAAVEQTASEATWDAKVCRPQQTLRMNAGFQMSSASRRLAPDCMSVVLDAVPNVFSQMNLAKSQSWLPTSDYRGSCEYGQLAHRSEPQNPTLSAW